VPYRRLYTEIVRRTVVLLQSAPRFDLIRRSAEVGHVNDIVLGEHQGGAMPC